MRDYLDMLHEDHENDERKANVPPIDDCIRRYSEVKDVLHVLFDDKNNQIRSICFHFDPSIRKGTRLRLKKRQKNSHR